jgi:hypothetical protein
MKQQTVERQMNITELKYLSWGKSSIVRNIYFQLSWQADVNNMKMSLWQKI